ncbi:Delta-aminolevulinic acid dehydratase [Streptomyces glaucescens]
MTKYGSFPGTRPRRLRTSPVMRRMVAETRLHPADFILPGVRAGGRERAGADRRPCRAWCSTRGTACRKAAAGGGGGRDLRDHAVRRAGGGEEGRPRDAGDRSRTGSSRSPSGTCGPRSGTTCWSCPTCASTRPPTTGTAGCSTSRGASTTTPRSSGTPRWRRCRPTPGAHVVGASGMMDGQIGVARDALDQIGREDVAVLAYTAKYAVRLLRAVPGGPSGPRCRATGRRTSRTRRTCGSRC